MKFTPVQKAFIALIVANVIWGAGSPIFKIALQNVPLFTLAFLRFSLGALILLVILRSKIFFTVHDRKDIFLLIGYALSGITFNIIFFFLGLQHTLAINSGVIVSSAPIMTLLFAMVFLHEQFSIKKFLGMFLGVGGILLIILQSLLQTGLDGSVGGNISILLATVGAVVAIVIGRDIFKRYWPLMLTFWAFIVSSATFLPLAIVDYIQNPGLYAAFDTRGVFGILWGAIFSSTVAYSLQAWGLARISATDTSIFTYIDPVAAAVLSLILLHEPITAPFLLGSILIFAGIGLAEGRLHWHPLHRLAPFQKKESAKESKERESTLHLNRSEVLQKIFKH